MEGSHWWMVADLLHNDAVPSLLIHQLVRLTQQGVEWLAVSEVRGTL